MRVLIACEYSATIREAFAARGHDAWSCDLLPSELPGKHIQGNVLEVLGDGWDLMIAHPPCQYLAYSGNRYWNQTGRAQKRRAAAMFFYKLYQAPIPRVCIENPVGWMNTIFRKPDQIIHPYFFGDRQLKKTCLWLRGLPKLWFWKESDLFGQRTMTDYPEPVYVTQRESGLKLRYFTEANHGWMERARTFPSIASAMADQWG